MLSACECQRKTVKKDIVSCGNVQRRINSQCHTWPCFHAHMRHAIVLLRTEDPVSGIAKTRADVGMGIQAAVQMTDIDLDVGMILVQTL